MIVRPLFFEKPKKAAVVAVRRNVCAFPIALLPFIDPLSVQPFVEGAAVIEHAVDDDLDPPLILKVIYFFQNAL